jgi:hypothetical protein
VLLPNRCRSSLLLALTAAAVSLVCLVPGLAAAATSFASASSFTGDPLTVSVEIDDAVDPGNLVITLEIDDEDRMGDLRGFFAEVTDESLLSGLSVSGDEVTGSRFEADSVINLGGGSNLNGGGSPCPCDLGVEIGDPGMGRGDDYQSVTLTLSHVSESLSLDLFADQYFGVRVTSVGGGDEGREGSSKLIGVVPEPSTTVLMLLGLGGLAASRPTTRA